MVRKRRGLIVGRMGPGVCLVYQYIYVTGGLSTLSEVDRGQKHPTPVTACERYNTMTNVWEKIPEMPLAGARAAPSLLLVQKRWVYQIGGNYSDNSIYRLAYSNTDQPW